MTTLPHLETSDIPRPGGATMDYDGSAGLSEGPERDLLFAVLNDAVQILLGAVRTPSLPRDSGDIGRRYKEVVRWMESCDTDYVFSFECVCESLGMNPAHIRAGFKKRADRRLKNDCATECNKGSLNSLIEHNNVPLSDNYCELGNKRNKAGSNTKNKAGFVTK